MSFYWAKPAAAMIALLQNVQNICQNNSSKLEAVLEAVPEAVPGSFFITLGCLGGGRGGGVEIADVDPKRPHLHAQRGYK